MVRYEILMLADPNITQDETKLVEKTLADLIKLGKGEVVAFDKWGKCRLAYPVRKFDYGVYFLMRFELEKVQEVLAELRTLFAIKFNETIMRHVVIKLDPKQSLDYKRPLSVDEVPHRNVDDFLRKNKMDSLITETNSDNDSEETDNGKEL